MSQRLASSRLVSLALRNATRRERISPCRRPALLLPSPRRRFSARRSGFSFLEKYLEINPLAAGLHQVWRNPHLSTLTL